ncbi:MAG: biliverdin-producing heme oxygenase [Brevibacterium sp.]|uniref:biliverdin-producing heme oxygenase n=1 Tax=Brevibacterium sp. TaxID=1701 RepID=UPI00264822F6|nr:biliverdin-producing heme oxygenase [Brevibacterium sp.]MDN5805896.1 biliverdin-producing heme oxygenase [Brevibacterium sp.]MDN5832985.1 biliverdin-producing heme oxygenase [Brevibacterium sp.]MDN5876979.1 biliverdin-producing heme oxygenase [Brevibacterium sp.]MDN5910281.1 biliverdin-producing heme oxygenase [Brevibacterium sp.]MDN6133313.1 biliverdin-producing heme oxygenase [Brevibacterium sp.]
MAEPFSAQLKASTATIHDEVEHTSFMVDLMEGRLDVRAYSLLLTQYALIYAALESKTREFADSPLVAPFHNSALFRTNRIHSDLEKLGASAARQRPNAAPQALGDSGSTVTASAETYADHLNRLTRPEQLIAHHYTRYLGDLSGGQAIGALMGRHYSVPADALTMWDFTKVGKTKPYKDAYRSRLDEIGANGGDEQLVIDETLTAFALNGRLLAELSSGAEAPADAAAATTAGATTATTDAATTANI